MNIEVPPYENGRLLIDWDPDPEIRVVVDENGARLVANRDGMTSLARILLTLAQAEVPTGEQLHLDESNGLEPESVELLIERI